jgi:catalase
MVGHLRNIDADLAQRVADGLALPLPDAPTPAMPVQDMAPSPALQIIGKMRDTLVGRAIGILVADGSDGTAIESLRKAVTDAGASVKIVAPKVGGATLADGTLLPADGQLAGTPSVMFDAIAVVLSAAGAQMLCSEAAALDFVSDAFAHLKAIAANPGAQALLDKANVVPDAGVLAVDDARAFIAAAATRQWAREPAVRMLP